MPAPWFFKEIEMKFKNLHEEKITICTKDGVLVANHGDFIELDEKTYNAIKSIYTKLELVNEKPTIIEKPKIKANKKCK